MEKRRDNRQKGFTLVELLIAVAIISVLSMIGAVAATTVQRNMRQTQLDKLAETIFVAAQENLTEVRSYRGIEWTSLTTGDSKNIPKQNQETSSGSGLFYVSKSGTDYSIEATYLLPRRAVSEELWDNNWVIEYDPVTGLVYSVFYSETCEVKDFYGAGISAEMDKNLRSANRGDRLGVLGGQVGYYSGATDGGSATPMPGGMETEQNIVQTMTRRISVHNTNELVALLDFSLSGESETVTGIFNKGFQVTMILTGEGGAKTERSFSVGSSPVPRSWNAEKDAHYSVSVRTESSGQQTTYLVECEVVIDSLKDGLGFREQFVKPSETTPFVAGENITVQFRIDSNDTAFPPVVTETETVNSLYDRYEIVEINGEKAYTPDIRYGRHLQNLDATRNPENTYAGRWENAPIRAVQVADIDFAATDAEEWSNSSLYPGRKLQAIHNSRIDSYDGGQHLILNMQVESPASEGDDGIGLFSVFNGSELTGIRLVTPRISGTTIPYAGGLAGHMTADAQINDCRLYMVDPLVLTGTTKASDVADLWLRAADAAGGLVGKADGTLSITDSYAASVIKAGNYAGGLIGQAAELQIVHSYADNYLQAAQIGGLAGTCSASSTFQTSYSAGFALDPTGVSKVGGFVPERVASVTNSYTVFSMSGFSAAKTCNVVEGADTAAQVWYLEGLGAAVPGIANTSALDLYDTSRAGGSGAVLAAIDGFESAEKSFSHPYHIHPDASVNEKIAVRYPYPMLSGLWHYNDFSGENNLTVEFYYYAEQKPFTFVRNTSNDGYIESAASTTYTQSVPTGTALSLPVADRIANVQRLDSVLYWYFTYDGTDYYYVPDEEDSEIGEPPYKGTFYYASATVGGTAYSFNINTRTPELAVSSFTNEDNPLRNVTEPLKLYACFSGEELRSIRVNYIRLRSDNTWAEAVTPRIENVYVNNGKMYIAPTKAPRFGTYRLLGWYQGQSEADVATNRVSAGLLADHSATEILTSLGLDWSGREGVIELDPNGVIAATRQVYVLYEEIVAYPVIIQYRVFDSTRANGIGDAISVPRYYYYTKESAEADTRLNNGQMDYVLPISAFSGYQVYQQDNIPVVLRTYKDGTGKVITDKVTVTEREGSYHTQIDMRKEAVYSLLYTSINQQEYTLTMHFRDTKPDSESREYSRGETRDEKEYWDEDGHRGMAFIGTSVLSTLDENGHKKYYSIEGFDLIESECTGVQILPTVNGALPHVDLVYQRQEYSIYFDLDGGLYQKNGGTYGYHNNVVLKYGQPLADGMTTFADPTSIGLIKPGYTFSGWKFYYYGEDTEHATPFATWSAKYNYNGSFSEYTTTGSQGMPARAVVAVACWDSAYKGVRIEVYRQSRTDSIGTMTPTYLLERSATLDSAEIGINRLNTIQSVDPRSINTTINSWNYDYLRQVMQSSKSNYTMYYFTYVPGKTTRTIGDDGYIVIRLYYNRKVVNFEFRYKNYYNYSAYNNVKNKYQNAEPGSILRTAYENRLVTFNDTTKTMTFRGLYEADMLSADGYEWPADRIWKEYESSNSSYREGSTTLTFMGQFADPNNISMIENTSASEITLRVGDNGSIYTDSSIEYYFELTSLEGARRYNTPIADEYFPNVAGESIQTNGGGNFTLNNKYAGYEVYQYRADSDINWQSKITVGQTSVSYTEVLRIRLKRKDYDIFFQDAWKSGSIGNALDARHFLYLEPITGLPGYSSESGYLSGLTDNQQIINAVSAHSLSLNGVACPRGSEYVFGGWFLSSDTNDEDARFTYADGTILLPKYDGLIHSNMNLFPKWIAPQRYLNFDWNFPEGGSLSGQHTIWGDISMGESVESSAHHTLPEPTLGWTDISYDGGYWYYSFAPAGSAVINRYRFDGWWRYTVDDQGRPVSRSVKLEADEPIYENETVYALWTQMEGVIDYKIIYHKYADPNNPEDSDEYKYASGQTTIGTTMVRAELGVFGDEYAPLNPSEILTILPGGLMANGQPPTVTFHYAAGTPWEYSVTYNASYTGHYLNSQDGGYGLVEGEAVTVNVPFRRTYAKVVAERYEVVPTEVDGYSTEQITVPLVRPENNNTDIPDASFSYQKDMSGDILMVEDEDVLTPHIEGELLQSLMQELKLDDRNKDFVTDAEVAYLITVKDAQENVVFSQIYGYDGYNDAYAKLEGGKSYTAVMQPVLLFKQEDCSKLNVIVPEGVTTCTLKSTDTNGNTTSKDVYILAFGETSASVSFIKKLVYEEHTYTTNDGWTFTYSATAEDAGAEAYADKLVGDYSSHRDWILEAIHNIEIYKNISDDDWEAVKRGIEKPTSVVLGYTDNGWTEAVMTFSDTSAKALDGNTHSISVTVTGNYDTIWAQVIETANGD